MIAQAELFDVTNHGNGLCTLSAPTVRSTDRAASHIAAHSIVKDGSRSKWKQVCLEAVKAYPGLTSRELAARSGIDNETMHKRLPDLERDGLVVYSETLRRCAVSGKVAGTWRAACE